MKLTILLAVLALTLISLPWKKRVVPPIPTTVVASFVVPAGMMAREGLQVFDAQGSSVIFNMGEDFPTVAEGDIVEITAQMIGRKITFSRSISTEELTE